MKKALFLSLLLHGIILLLGLRFLKPVTAELRHYKNLAVSLVSLPEIPAPLMPEPGKIIHERIDTEKVQREKPEKPFVEPVKPESPVNPAPSLIPDSTDTEAVKSDIMEVQDSIGSVSAGQEEMTETVTAGIVAVEDTESNKPALSGPGAQLDISWSGGASRSLLSGDSPDISISRNSSLWDKVLIHFSVNPDGSVFNVRIKPPGSSSFQVDRQLREWASLLVFNEDKRSSSTAHGIITINLLAREFSPR